ncbi:hypothetical protein ACFLRN_09910 [Thermoproteota archaeon]
MNKKILVVIVTLLFVAMMVTPVFAAIGPTKAKNNKNITRQVGNQVWLKNKGGVFQEWNTFPNGVKLRLMRLDASKVNIGNAEDASLWPPILPDMPGLTIGRVALAETNWVYFDYDTMYDLLRGFGMNEATANFIRAPFNPLGCYYKIEIVG